MSVAVGIVRPDRFILAADTEAFEGNGYRQNEFLPKVIQPHEDFAVAAVGTVSQINALHDMAVISVERKVATDDPT